MAKILQDIWILESTSGIVLFNRFFDRSFDTQLFGGLMSALNTFAEILANEGLSSFEFSKKRCGIIKRKNILFVGNASIKTREKRIIDELYKISDDFFDKYNDILECWYGDVTAFSNFGLEIQDSLKRSKSRF
ncbi:MAG: hypothetical protein KGD63_07665 [Candidatus Lokiarchaeota archaeon]|nr:hypothetical protein [Candidatus Lokiarchaeota archaeon]